MTAFLVIAAALAAHPATPAFDKPDLDAIWAVFYDNPVLVERHRGYLAYLKAHPALAKAEAEYWEAVASPGLGYAIVAFEEALVASPPATRAYLDYLAALQAAPALQESEDALFHIEANDLFLRKDGGAGMDTLRAEPQDALAVIEGSEAKAGPRPELLGFGEHLAKHPELRQALLIQFRSINAQQPVPDAVLSWWRLSADAKTPVGTAYRALRVAFAKRPSAFAAWRNRARLWARDAHAFAWTRAWWAQVRRSDRLAPVYPSYMAFVGRHPEWAGSAEQAWQQTAGPPPAWPPAEEPPVFTPLPAHGAARPGAMPIRPSARATPRPGKPNVPMPRKPAMPQMPSQASGH